MKYNEYLKEMTTALLSVDEKQISKVIDLCWEAYKNSRMIFLIGNGGSAANASHFAQDLAKGTRIDVNQARRIRALSLTDNVSFISALSNDDGYETIFEQQLRTFAEAGDLLIAISGSGNSANIVKAVQWANSHDVEVIGITGFSGGKLRESCKYSLHVPYNEMCTTESIHSVLFHYIVLELRHRISEYLK
jgi:D-sedoheptulose 7-phosphate isomerase